MTTTGPQDPEPDPGALADRARAEVREVVRAEDAGPTSRAKSIDDLGPHERVRLQDDRQTVELKRSYAKNLFRLMLAQIVVADGVFIAYAWAGRSWDVPTAAMHAWLAATVVEIIGIVYVVTRHLFPDRGAA